MSQQANVPQQRAPEQVSQRPTVAPRVDIFENAQEFLVVADLPGVPKHKLNIKVEKDQLLLEGSRAEDAQENLLSREYRPADFARSFVLPGGIDLDKVEALLEAGVLRLRLPKSDALKPRTIPVRGT